MPAFAGRHMAIGQLKVVMNVVSRTFRQGLADHYLAFQRKEQSMNKQKSSGSSKQSSPDSAATQTSADMPKEKSGKDAKSHTKADSGKGAGGGAKQGRKH